MQSLKSTRRVWHVIKILRQHGIFVLLQNVAPDSRFIQFLARNESVDDTIARGVRVRQALEELGPVFVKFGQILSTRPDLIPEDIAGELVYLQDRVPPFDNDQAREIIEQDLNEPIDTIFESVEDEVMASASIAQVYGAILKNGDPVVIKVVRPGIEEEVHRDIQTLYSLADLFDRFAPSAKLIRPREVVQEFDNSLRNELNMMSEAGNASQLKSNFADSDLLYVPEVYFDYCSRRILVMERINAISIRDIEQIDAAGIDRKKLAHNGVIIFFTQAFRDGFFHADMHPGNVMVGANGQYKAVDFGIMGTLSPRDQQYLAETLIAFFNRDYQGVARAYMRAGWAPDYTRLEEFEGAIRSICEPIFARPIAEISFGHFIVNLLQVARQFGLEMQPQLVMLEKTLLQIEGLGRVLYPQLDLWQTAKPFLEQWMGEQVGVDAAIKTLKREAPRWSSIIPEIPGLASDALFSLRDQRTLLQSQSMELAKLRHQFALQNKINVVAAVAALFFVMGLITDRAWWVLAVLLGLYVVYLLGQSTRQSKS